MSKFIFLKSLRELLTPLKRLIDKKAENVNWNENDPSSNSYIANRTHYKEEKEVLYANNIKLIFTNLWDNVYGSEAPRLSYNIGDILTITWDGTIYKCKVGRVFNDVYTVGNLALIGEGGDSGEPFAWIYGPYGGSEIYTLDTAESHTISCSGIKTIVHQIPSEYLPENSVGKKGTSKSAEIFNDYENNIASDEFSHAEGYNTQAYGWASHTEGNWTQAGGSSSHAEGYKTTARSDYQHVQGKFNIEDSSQKYAHIVGNGTSNSKRKNAHTLDWNGLGWFAGGLKIGGTDQDDANAKSVATEAYVDEKIAAIPTPDVSGQIEASIAALVDSAPETLNTLNELAIALGNDPNFATTIIEQLNSLTKQITAPKDSITFIDQVNGYHYIACMREGNFVTYCAIRSIEVATMPAKTEYYAGDTFDSTGMVIVATTYDGTTKEITNYSCIPEVLDEDTTSIKIVYIENGVTYEAMTPITVKSVTDLLIDFEYTDNGDGTYTIIDWKGTYNGEPSTEIIIPNNKNIIV